MSEIVFVILYFTGGCVFLALFNSYATLIAKRFYLRGEVDLSSAMLASKLTRDDVYIVLLLWPIFMGVFVVRVLSDMFFLRMG